MTRLTEAEFVALMHSNPDIDAPLPETRPRGKARKPVDPAPSEHDEQVALFQWAEANIHRWPELRTMFAIPNGGARDAVTGAMLQREGVCAGVPDICLPVQSRGFEGQHFGCMFIELKRADGSNHPTPSQRAWIAMLCEQGQMAIVAYGAQQAIDAITAYLGGED